MGEAQAEHNIASLLPNKSDIGQAADQTTVLLFLSRKLILLVIRGNNFMSLTSSPSAYCILRKMRKLRIGCVGGQYMCKICARFSPNAQYIRVRFVQDCTYFPNVQYMCKICTRLYFVPQCAIYAQDLCKIVLISPMHNICTRFAQDCTSFSNAQYMHRICARLYFSPQCAKIAGIIGRNMSHITYLF